MDFEPGQPLDLTPPAGAALRVAVPRHFGDLVVTLLIILEKTRKR